MKPPAGRGKTLTAKLSCKTDAGQSGHMTGRQSTLAPPMSSIIVERHQPIVKVSVEMVARLVLIFFSGC